MAYARMAPGAALYGARNQSQTDPSRFAATLAIMSRLNAEQGAEVADREAQGPRVRLKAATSVVPRHGGPAPEVDSLALYRGRAPRDGDDTAGNRLWRYRDAWSNLDADGRDAAEREFEARWCEEVLDNPSLAEKVRQAHSESLARQAVQLVEHARLERDSLPRMHLREVLTLRDSAAALEKMHAVQTMRPQHVAPVAPIPLREESARMVASVSDAPLMARLEEELREQTREQLAKHAKFFARRTVDPVKNRGLRQKKLKDGAVAPANALEGGAALKKAMLPNALRRFVQNVLYGTGNVAPIFDPLPAPSLAGLTDKASGWECDLHEPILAATQLTLPISLPQGSAHSEGHHASLPPARGGQGRPLHVEEDPAIAARSLPRGLKPKRKQHTTAGPGGASTRVSQKGINGVEWADPNDDPSKLGLDVFTALVDRVMALPEDEEGNADAMDLDASLLNEEESALLQQVGASAFEVQCALEKRASKGTLPSDGDIQQLYSEASGISAWASVQTPHRDAPDGIAPIVKALGPAAPEGVSVNDARVFLNSLSLDTVNKITVASLSRAWAENYERDTLEATLGATDDPELMADIQTSLNDHSLRDTRGGLSPEAGRFTATRSALRDTEQQRRLALERARALSNQEQLPGLIALLKRMDERAHARGEICYDNHLEKAAEVLPETMYPECEVLDRSWVQQHGFLAGYLMSELRALGARPCKNAFNGKCVAIEISRRTRGRVEQSHVSRYAPELLMMRDAARVPTQNGAESLFSLLQQTTDQVYFLQAGGLEEVFVMREFLTPREMERASEWLARADVDPEFAAMVPSPLTRLPQTCLLCENEAIDLAANAYNSGQTRPQDPSHSHPTRPDLLLPLSRFEWRTGPGQYAPSAMRPNSFFSKDQDNSHLPGRPIIVGKTLAHVLHHYQLRTLMNTELVGAAHTLVNRPYLAETSALDFRPILSNINASFAGLPKWGWGTLSPQSIPALPRVSSHYRPRPIVITPLKFYETASPFELYQNEQQAWFFHLGVEGAKVDPAESPVSRDWNKRYEAELAKSPCVPSWSVFVLCSSVGLHDTAWFARILKTERFARFDSWSMDHYRALEYGGAGAARAVAYENLENLPLVLLRRFLLMRGRLAMLLFFEDGGLALGTGRDKGVDPRQRGEDVDEIIEDSYLHQLYNPSAWDVHRLSVPPQFVARPEVQAQLAEERVRWEALLAPTISTLRYLEGKVYALKRANGPGWREQQAWVYEKTGDVWRRGRAASHFAWASNGEYVPLLDIFYAIQSALPRALFEEAKRRVEEAERLGSMEERPDMIDLANLAAEGFSLLAVCLFKLYHLYRLVALGMEYEDACLLAAARGMIQELVHHFVVCVAQNAWSDAAWFDANTVRLPTKITMDPLQSSLAPDARLYARGHRVPKEVPFAKRRCSLAQMAWPGVRAARVSLHEAPDLSILSEHMGTTTSMPGEYTSTQDYFRGLAMLILLYRKCEALKSQKREERSIAHRIMAKYPAIMVINHYGLHNFQTGNLPTVFETPSFFTLCNLWASHKSMQVKMKRAYPKDDPLETLIRLRTWLVTCMLYEPMPDKHLKKRTGAAKPNASSSAIGMGDLAIFVFKGAYFRYHNRWFVQWLIGFAQRQTTMSSLMRAHPHQGVMHKSQQSIVRAALRASSTRMQFIPIVFPCKSRLKYQTQVLHQCVALHAQHAMQTRLHGAMNKQLRIVVQKAPFWELFLEILNKFYNSIISKVIQSLRPMLAPLVSTPVPEAVSAASKGATRSKRGKNTGVRRKKGKNMGQGNNEALDEVSGVEKGVAEAARQSAPAMAESHQGADNEADGDGLYGAAPRSMDLDSFLNELQAAASSAMMSGPADGHFFANATAEDNVWDQFRDDMMLNEMEAVARGEASGVESTRSMPDDKTRQPEVVLYDSHRHFAAAVEVDDGSAQARRSFDPTKSPPTALRCNSLVELQRILRFFVARLLRVSALDDPGREEAHEAFKRIIHRDAIKHVSQSGLAKTFLGYFGVPERVMQLINAIQNQYTHGSPLYGIESTIHKIFYDYPEQLATVWRYLRYRAAWVAYLRTCLPRHIALHQMRAVIARHAHLHPVQVPAFAQTVHMTQLHNQTRSLPAVSIPPAAGMQEVRQVPPVPMELDQLEGMHPMEEADLFAGLETDPMFGQESLEDFKKDFRK